MELKSYEEIVNEAKKFPCIMEYIGPDINGELVVNFTGPEKGKVVKSETKNFPKGYESSEWIPCTAKNIWKPYSKSIDESKGMPDLGETVSFEDGFKVKDEDSKKNMEVKPNAEYEVISVIGKQMELKGPKCRFFITKAEYDKMGGYLV